MKLTIPRNKKNIEELTMNIAINATTHKNTKNITM